MKKILIILSTLILITGCEGTKANNPKEQALKYVNDLKKMEKETVLKIDYNFFDDITETQKNNFNDIIENNLKNAKYFVSNEIINESDAIITIEFEVYDIKDANSKIDSYVELNQDKFLKKGIIDVYKVNDYKIEEFKIWKQKVQYTVDIKFIKEDKSFIMTELSETDFKKLFGTY